MYWLGSGHCILYLSSVTRQVLVDGPGNDAPGNGARDTEGVHRQVISLKRLSLTDLVIPNLPRNAKKSNILKGWEVSPGCGGMSV